MAQPQVPESIQRIIVQHYLSGKTLEESAALGGVSRKACRNALVRQGLSLRTRREVSRLYRHHPFNEGFFDAVTTEAQAYWLGFLTADGSVSEPNRSVSVLLARRDEAHLLKLQQALGSDCPVRLGSYRARGRTYLTASVTFFSTDFIAALARLGVVPRKSLIAVPWPGPDHLLPHFWRGVVDGDGCIHRRTNGYWSISLVGSRDIVTGFADFIRQRFGCGKQPTQRLNIFQVGYGGTGFPQAIAGLLYRDATVYLDRKHALALQLLALTPKHPFGSRKDLSGVTAETLLALYRDCGGNWPAVARHLGIRPANIHRTRKRLALPLAPG